MREMVCFDLDFIAMHRIIMKAIKQIAENHTVSTSLSGWSNWIVPSMRSTYE